MARITQSQTCGLEQRLVWFDFRINEHLKEQCEKNIFQRNTAGSP